QLGNVLVNTKWMPVEEAERRAAGSRQQANYLQLRLAANESPEDQYALARWCSKNNLVDESRLHWANVLTADPNNKEALRALDVRWFQGQLVHTADISEAKSAESVRRREQLAVQIDKWRTALAGKSGTAIEDVCAEIR